MRYKTSLLSAGQRVGDISENAFGEGAMSVLAKEERRSARIRANEDEYGEAARNLNWVTPERADSAGAERQGLLDAMGGRIRISSGGTKPHLGPLSPGCQVCVRGGWSCLFVNGRCNCRCFYCPAEQGEIGVPTTNRVAFSRAEDYAAYVRHFGFEGVSISGGEPLLTFDRTLDYLNRIRKDAGDGVHLWLYTNGTLLTAERADMLRDIGLNEIRFDIGADGYALDKVRLAAGRIPCVTVEIPAVPEDMGRLCGMLAEMREAGVDHLNLHQLRLTPHNLPHLAGRGYTFLHGERVTVLESELAALSLMANAAEGGRLPVNYCSFVYKNRYQRAAMMRRSADEIRKPHESVTESGYIRSLTASGPSDRILGTVKGLKQQDADPKRWSASANMDRLFFHESLWALIDADSFEIQTSYAEAMLSPRLSYRAFFREVRLDSGATVFVERQPAGGPVILSERLKEPFRRAFLAREPGVGFPADIPEGRRILEREMVTPGLQNYY